MRRAVGVTFECDGGHGDHRRCRQAAFPDHRISPRLEQTEAPAVIMNDDGNVIRVVEGCRSSIERGIVEVPLRRSLVPNELRKVVPVFVVALLAAFGGKIKLVPPFKLGLRWQWNLARCLAADQVAADGD